MSSSDTSLTQAWNSEAAETEVEYDLEVRLRSRGVIKRERTRRQLR